MGSGFIRSTLIENSWVAIRNDPALLSKFMRIWRGSGSKKKAIVGWHGCLSCVSGRVCSTVRLTRWGRCNNK
jgi:hypothetical protein